MYQDQQLTIGDVLDAVGILYPPSEYVYETFMTRNQMEETLYPEFYVLKVIPTVKPMVDTLTFASIREQLLETLTGLVGGDVLLAKYLLCFLLSKP
jgi:hypothetical protein